MAASAWVGSSKELSRRQAYIGSHRGRVFQGGDFQVRISRISSPELGTNQGLVGISILESGEFSKSEGELRHFALHKG